MKSDSDWALVFFIDAEEFVDIKKIRGEKTYISLPGEMGTKMTRQWHENSVAFLMHFGIQGKSIL